MARKKYMVICRFCKHAWDTDDPDGDMKRHLKKCPDRGLFRRLFYFFFGVKPQEPKDE
ncbi:MAG: hypothetical protein ACREH5_08005 [Candidatus Omnitrophota bacterium]